jgi:hypothetical protein
VVGSSAFLLAGATGLECSSFGITITHQATHRLLCSNFSRRKTFLSSPNHHTLWILLRVTFGCSLSENGPQGDTLCNHEGHQIECDGRTPEDTKRRFLPVLPTIAGSMEQVCAYVQGSYFEGDWVSAAICPTITVQYHHSGNIFTAPCIVNLFPFPPL